MEAEHMPDEARLRELLVGRKVVSVEMIDEWPEDRYGGLPPVGRLTLSDGTELEVYGHDGGCACSAGCYPLTELNAVDNLITNVRVEASPEGDGYVPNGEGFYKIFVFADHPVLLASFEGSDGNGYYGTGWWLRVRKEGESVG